MSLRLRDTAGARRNERQTAERVQPRQSWRQHERVRPARAKELVRFRAGCGQRPASTTSSRQPCVSLHPSTARLATRLRITLHYRRCHPRHDTEGLGARPHRLARESKRPRVTPRREGPARAHARRGVPGVGGASRFFPCCAEHPHPPTPASGCSRPRAGATAREPRSHPPSLPPHAQPDGPESPPPP